MATTIRDMTTREKALQLVEELPDSRLDDLIDFLEPEDKPGDPVARREAVEHLMRIANGEDDGYDFAVSRRLHTMR